jgi:hypothetical protein
MKGSEMRIPVGKEQPIEDKDLHSSTDAKGGIDPATVSFEAPAPPDMVEGYKDGLNPDSPPPSDNRSHSYRHGFANGRDDLAKQPRALAATLRTLAQEAIAKDRDALI